MQRGDRILRKNSFNPAEARDRVTLEFDDRFRRRFRLFTENHQDILLNFDECEHMRDGDAIQLNDGSLVLVCARPEELLEITAREGDLLMRIAWHLGNRHLPVQFENGRLLIREDYVIANMVRGLGGDVRALRACFDPENGAYSAHGAAS
jgi:urease accessory protein